jgi:hypothetical protein
LSPAQLRPVRPPVKPATIDLVELAKQPRLKPGMQRRVPVVGSTTIPTAAVSPVPEVVPSVEGLPAIDPASVPAMPEIPGVIPVLLPDKPRERPAGWSVKPEEAIGAGPESVTVTQVDGQMDVPPQVEPNAQLDAGVPVATPNFAFPPAVESSAANGLPPTAISAPTDIIGAMPTPPATTVTTSSPAETPVAVARTWTDEDGKPLAPARLPTYVRELADPNAPTEVPAASTTVATDSQTNVAPEMPAAVAPVVVTAVEVPPLPAAAVPAAAVPAAEPSVASVPVTTPNTPEVTSTLNPTSNENAIAKLQVIASGNAANPGSAVPEAVATEAPATIAPAPTTESVAAAAPITSASTPAEVATSAPTNTTASSAQRAETLPTAPGELGIEALAARGETVRLSILEVSGTPGMVQWLKDGQSDWQIPEPGENGTGKYTLRTGPDAGAVLVIEGTKVRVGRMTRVEFRAMQMDEAGKAAANGQAGERRTVLALTRGRVAVIPGTGVGAGGGVQSAINVYTPQSLVVVREPTEVIHDTASGTRTVAYIEKSPASAEVLTTP